MSKLPSYRESKEYETTLHKYRVEKGYTIKQLAELAETNTNMIVSLANGTVAPVHSGEVKPVVQRLVEILDTPVEVLFPRYAFQINTVPDGTTDEQLIDALYRNVTPDRAYDSVEFTKALKDSLTDKEYNVIRMRFYDDLSLEAASEILKMTRESIRQIEAKSLRKLRHPGRHMEEFLSLLQG